MCWSPSARRRPRAGRILPPAAAAPAWSALRSLRPISGKQPRCPRSDSRQRVVDGLAGALKHLRGQRPDRGGKRARDRRAEVDDLIYERRGSGGRLRRRRATHGSGWRRAGARALGRPGAAGRGLIYRSKSPSGVGARRAGARSLDRCRPCRRGHGRTSRRRGCARRRYGQQGRWCGWRATGGRSRRCAAQGGGGARPAERLVKASQLTKATRQRQHQDRGEDRAGHEQCRCVSARDLSRPGTRQRHGAMVLRETPRGSRYLEAGKCSAFRSLARCAWR